MTMKGKRNMAKTSITGRLDSKLIQDEVSILTKSLKEEGLILGETDILSLIQILDKRGEKLSSTKAKTPTELLRPRSTKETIEEETVRRAKQAGLKLFPEWFMDNRGQIKLIYDDTLDRNEAFMIQKNTGNTRESSIYISPDNIRMHSGILAHELAHVSIQCTSTTSEEYEHFETIPTILEALIFSDYQSKSENLKIGIEELTAKMKSSFKEYLQLISKLTKYPSVKPEQQRDFVREVLEMNQRDTATTTAISTIEFLSTNPKDAVATIETIDQILVGEKPTKALVKAIK